MKHCEICINADEEKRSGICATCKYNCTYASHFKVSKQVSRIMENFNHSLDDVLKEKE